MKTDGSENQRIIDEPCLLIYVIDDWVYYVHKEGFPANVQLYRVCVDGTGNEAIQ